MRENATTVHLANSERISRLAMLGLESSPWYDTAHDDIKAVCESESWDKKRFVSILSLTSPRVSVRRNVRISFHYYHSGALLDNVTRSVRQSLSTWEGTGKINGQKTAAFCDAILGNPHSLVLDSWMSKALQIDQYYFTRPIVRQRAYVIIERVANRLGLSVRDTQAAVWCGSFAERGLRPPGFAIASEYKNWVAYNRQYPTTGSIAIIAA